MIEEIVDDEDENFGPQSRPRQIVEEPDDEPNTHQNTERSHQSRRRRREFDNRPDYRGDMQLAHPGQMP